MRSLLKPDPITTAHEKKKKKRNLFLPSASLLSVYSCRCIRPSLYTIRIARNTQDEHRTHSGLINPPEGRINLSILPRATDGAVSLSPVRSFVRSQGYGKNKPGCYAWNSIVLVGM